MLAKRNLPMASCLLSCLVLFFLVAPAGYAATWNIQDEFSTASNPNGPYSYGSIPTFHWEFIGEFSLYDTTHPTEEDCGAAWIHSTTPCSDMTPGVWKNTSGNVCHNVQPGEVSLHPGCEGSFSVIRWTSPVAGTIKIKGYFGAGDANSMVYRIHKDGTLIFEIYGAYDDGPFDLVEEVSVGTTIDFMIGHNYQFGNTPLHASITYDGPMVTITAPDPTACEASRSTGVFKISRTGDTSEPLTVKYIVSGTAKSIKDYVKLAGSVLIPTGKTFATILINPKTDKLQEGDETVILTLKSDDAYAIGTPNSAVVTIVDNHPNE